MTGNVIIRVPEQARAGEVVAARVLIRHPMESGQRRDRHGEPIPRNIIHSLAARYDGNEVFRAELLPGIAANPYFEFSFVATRSGEVVFSWADDDGNSHTRAVPIAVR